MRWFVVVLILCASTSVEAGMYRWVDEAGQVHFGDRPPTDAQSSEVRIRINTYQGASVEALDRALAAERDVVIYTASWCHVCTDAKRYFRANDIQYVEYDVETSAKGKRDFARMNGRGVPIILVGRKRLNGFSPVAFERAYGARD